MKVPIVWKSLEEARTHFNKLPDLTCVISTPGQPRIYYIVPSIYYEMAKGFYANRAEVVCVEDIQILWDEPKKKPIPFWQQINRSKKR